MANPSGRAAGGPAGARARALGLLGGTVFFRVWLALSLVVLAVFVADSTALGEHAVLFGRAALQGEIWNDSGVLLLALLLLLLVPRWSRLADRFFTSLTGLATCAILVVFALAVVVLVQASEPTIDQFGWGFLSGSPWVPYPPPGVPVEYGALPAIYGTLLVAGLAMLIGIPLSIGIAMFLTELSPNWLREPLSFVIELLAAIPSVVYGMWGLLVLVPYMQANVDPTIASSFGTAPVLGPIFQPQANGLSGFNFLTAGIILAIMVIPTISSVTREAFMFVPRDQREAALSLGATRWETTRISVIPYARRGIFGAVTLGLGRAIGETIAVVLVIGNTYAVSTSLLAPGSTIASWIANEWGESSGLQRSALLELGLVLLAMSVAVNVGARLLVRGSSRSGRPR
jgi:phosphate transport system permease protein